MNLLVDLPDLTLQVLKGRKALPQREQMLLAPGTAQDLGDLRLGPSAAAIPQRRQYQRVLFTLAALILTPRRSECRYPRAVKINVPLPAQAQISDEKGRYLTSIAFKAVRIRLGRP